MKILSNQDVDTKLDALFRAADIISPVPEVDDDGDGDGDDHAETVSNEIISLSSGVLSELGYTGGAVDRQRAGEMLYRINKEVSNTLFNGNRRKEGIARIGDQGFLDPKLYKIVRTAQFQDDYRRVQDCIPYRQITSTVHEPFQIEHLTTERNDQQGRDKYTLAVKTFSGNRSSGPFTMIADCDRNKDVLALFGVWKAYHSKVSIDSEMRPTEMLESFVNVYGLDLVFGDGQKGRFFRQVKISAPVDEELNLMASDGFRGQAFSARVMMSFSVEDAQRTANVSMAYAIDWNRYERDLRLLSKP